MSAEHRTSADRASKLVIAGGAALIDGQIVPAELAIDDERIGAIGSTDQPRAEPSAENRSAIAAAPAGPITQLDASGLLVAPGLVDLQINGGHGHDLWTDPASMWDLATLLPRHGVTAFCPTIISGPPEVTEAAMAALAARPPALAGAEPIGLHFEGPFLAPERRGAHRAEHLAPIEPARTASWTRANGVRLVTLAPERPGAIELIARLVGEGVVVAAGHSEATTQEARAAADAGLSMVTHLFNAMAPLHHREPGLAGFALGSDDLAAGMIVDGIHVAPEVVTMALRAMGEDRLVLVTDAVAAMGLPAGVHQLGDKTVHAGPDGVRRQDGTLAGSDLSLDQAVRNLVAFTGCSPAEAIGCASTVPARVIGEADRGQLRVGALADVVLLDAELRVVATFCRGSLAHLDPAAAWRISGADAPPSPLG